MSRPAVVILAGGLIVSGLLCAGCPGDDDQPPGPDVTHQVFRSPVAVATADVTLLTDPPQPRALPIRLYTPAARPTDFGAGRFPLAVISPDANEPIWRYAWLAKHLSGQGYMCVTIDHGNGGGDGRSQRRRLRDVSFVLDRLAEGRIPAMLELLPDLDRVAIVGHGAGAKTALLGGFGPDANTPIGSRREDRIDAVIALSPPAPGQMGLREEDYQAVTAPVLLVNAAGPAGRETTDPNAPTAFGSLPEGLAFELTVPVKDGRAFVSSGPQHARRRSPIYHLWVGQVATAFLNATLRNDRQAVRWLMDQRIEAFSHGKCELRHR
jgi:hypothetical protein